MTHKCVIGVMMEVLRDVARGGEEVKGSDEVTDEQRKLELDKTRRTTFFYLGVIEFLLCTR